MKGTSCKKDGFAYVDHHCHYNPDYTFLEFFQCVLEQFSQYEKGGVDKEFAFCLIEFEDTHWFSELAKQDESSGLVVDQVDNATLCVRRGEHFVTVFTGRQINTHEGLEVIIIGCDEMIESRAPLSEYIKHYTQDYLLVLPWGVGKWLGSRGDLVTKHLMDQSQLDSNMRFVLGDNGGRPSWWKSVPQFDLASKTNAVILAGSDPLTVPSFSERVAAYGNVFDSGISTCSDWISEVKSLTGSPERYGRLSSTLLFLRDQLGLRLVKIKRKLSKS